MSSLYDEPRIYRNYQFDVYPNAMPCEYQTVNDEAALAVLSDEEGNEILHTYLLEDPDQGDQFEQLDDRQIEARNLPLFPLSTST